MARSPRPPAIPLVTITSDIGAVYAAQIQAVLAHRLPAGHVIDLAHDLRPHAILEASFLLRAMAGGFPPGTVHLVVVDPGVGGRRAPIAVACRDGSTLIGPNNGVLSPLATILGTPRAHAILSERVRTGPRVGSTFDGRDLFAPAAAAVALGATPADLGPRVPMRALALSEPTRRGGGADGEIVHVDRFGNLITNVPTDWVPARTSRVLVTIGSRRPRELPWVTHYEALGRGDLGALGSSFGLVEVAIAEGNAGARLRTTTGASVRLDWAPGSRRASKMVNSVSTRRR